MSEPLIPTAPEPDDALPAGSFVGPYRIERIIGAGMFGTVYEGRHPVIENAVAIKVLHRRYSSDPDMTARFIDEARAASHIDHPGIVRIFDFGRLEDGRRYTVMERLVGQGLDALLEARGALEPEAALAILEPLARALAAAHAAGVAHRDVKPGNIFVCDEGPPKLLDFGVAKLLGMPSDAERTATGVAVGTPAYMAPEQCLGVGVGPAVDVYALGVLAFRMLGGRLPFEVEGSVPMMAAHLNDPPPWLHAVDPRFGRAPGRVLRRMMAKDPARRPGPEAAIGALRVALHRPVRSRVAVVAALALAAAGLGGLWAMSGGAESPEPSPIADAGAPVALGAQRPDATPDAAPDAAPAMTLDAAPDTAPPPTVVIALDGLPARAVVSLGGAPLAVRDGAVRLPRGDDALTLEFAAPGWRPGQAVVVPDTDRRLDVRLMRIPSPPRRSKPDPHGIDEW